MILCVDEIVIYLWCYKLKLNMTPGNTQKLRLWILPVPRPVKLNFFLYHCLSWIRVLIGCWITMWGWAEMFLLVESVTWHADSWAPTNTQTRNVDTHIVLVLVSGHVSESFNRSRSHWSSIIHQRLSFLYRDTSLVQTLLNIDECNWYSD